MLCRETKVCRHTMLCRHTVLCKQATDSYRIALPKIQSYTVHKGYTLYLKGSGHAHSQTIHSFTLALLCRGNSSSRLIGSLPQRCLSISIILHPPFVSLLFSSFQLLDGLYILRPAFRLGQPATLSAFWPKLNYTTTTTLHPISHNLSHLACACPCALRHKTQAAG